MKLIVAMMILFGSFVSVQAKEHVFETQKNWSAMTALDDRVKDLSCQFMFQHDGNEFGLIYKEKSFYLWAASKEPGFSNDQDFVLLHIGDEDRLTLRVVVARNDTEVIAALPEMIDMDRENSLVAYEIILSAIIMGGNDSVSIEFPEFEVWKFDTRKTGLERVRSKFMECTQKYDRLLEASGGQFRSETPSPKGKMLDRTPLTQGFQQFNLQNW